MHHAIVNCGIWGGLALNYTISQYSKKKGPNTPGSSGVARSLVLAGHLLYASPLASQSHMLRTRLRDMSGADMVPGPAFAMPLPGSRHHSCPN